VGSELDTSLLCAPESQLRPLLASASNGGVSISFILKLILNLDHIQSQMMVI